MYIDEKISREDLDCIFKNIELHDLKEVTRFSEI